MLFENLLLESTMFIDNAIHVSHVLPYGMVLAFLR